MPSKVLRIEKRTQGRLQMYQGELPEIILTVGGQQLYADACDLSVEGMGLVIRNEADWNPAWQAGQRLHLLFRHSQEQVEALISRISRARFDGADCLRIGCIFQQRPRTRFLREQRRFNLKDQNRIAMVCPHPQLYGRYIHGEVFDVSRSGLSFLTRADENSILPPYAELEARLLLATAAELSIRLLVRHIQIQGEWRLYGCEIQASSPKFSAHLAEQLLLSERSPTIRQLEDEGFEIVNTAKALQFYYAQAIDFIDILPIRQLCYKSDPEGALGELDAFRETFDANARQLCCRIGGQVVGAVRLLFPDETLSQSELLQHGVDIPSYFRKQGLIEASMLVIHPDFDVADLLMNILKKVCVIGAQKGQRYVTISCLEDHATFLETLGAMPVATYYLPGSAFNKRRQQVLLVDGERYLRLDNQTVLNRLNDESFLISGRSHLKLVHLNPVDLLRLHLHRFFAR